MGALKLFGSLIFLLAFFVISFYSAPAKTGDEPAPVVYIDPETGELRVQNPPKLPREHGPVAQATAPGDQPASNPQGSNYLYSLSGIFVIGVIVIITWIRFQRKNKGSSL